MSIKINSKDDLPQSSIMYLRFKTNIDAEWIYGTYRLYLKQFVAASSYQKMMGKTYDWTTVYEYEIPVGDLGFID